MPESTQECVRSVERFMQDTNTRLLCATSENIELWLDTLDIAANTRYWHLSNFATFYAWAVRQELTSHDPTSTIVRPRYRRGLPRPISDDGLARAIELAHGRIRCWILLAAYQGLRCQEIGGIRRDDVLEGNSPPLLFVRDGKGGKPRVLPLNQHVLEALLEHGLPASGHLWPGRHGGMSRHHVSEVISTYLRGIQVNATAHQLRHWFATATYRRSKDLLLVQQLLGHASPATTQIYVAISLDEAAHVVGGLSVRGAT
jgi:integrase